MVIIYSILTIFSSQGMLLSSVSMESNFLKGFLCLRGKTLKLLSKFIVLFKVELFPFISVCLSVSLLVNCILLIVGGLFIVESGTSEKIKLPLFGLARGLFEMSSFREPPGMAWVRCFRVVFNLLLLY